MNSTGPGATQSNDRRSQEILEETFGDSRKSRTEGQR